ncbi:NADPH:quinone oxidoreductase family protein [Tsuneonella sp. CC-YZS046]|uniref:NADPH:quinone oxidoreductase family protein n=1 Tax=Tsuneonella sp. CC-YZS046 TaxID=3042152 RepID=UPI002D787950|nr:NADPH:quinone oxidoreductase family protein [Tsuneonella sp. CC-YZS046]WRO67039.1 NADPH:quinone oxidoreductase family protein [Tsuneonella sp. CC-YZS046]
MRALLSTEAGGPETLAVGDIEEPVAGPGEVLVKVAGCAINFPDALIIRDLYQFKPQRPFAPGGEVSGTIEAVGEEVEGWEPGDRVAAITIYGGLREKTAIAASRLFPVPDGIDLASAAAMPMTYVTALYALRNRGELAAGDTLLVLGAAGGVGLAAVELGKYLGAQVIAAVSSEEKAQAAREAGADETVIYPSGPFDKDGSRALAAQFKDACGPDGAQVIIDNVGGDYSEPALRAIGWEGRFLVVGFPAGIARLPLNLTLLKSCDVRGVFLGAFLDRQSSAATAMTGELFDLWKAGRIKPKISATYPLERAGEAIAALADRKAVGKLLVRMDA